MKKIPVDRLKSGMVLSSSVKTKRGQTLAKPGTVLNYQLIARFNFYHIDAVDIENEIEEAPETLGISQAPSQNTSPVVPAGAAQAGPANQGPAQSNAKAPQPSAPVPQARKAPEREEKKERTRVDDSLSFSQKIEQSPEFMQFQMDYATSIKQLQQDFQDIKAGKLNVETDLALQDANTLFQHRTALELFDMIHNMRSIDDSVYAHSLNVALIARVLGKWAKLSREDLQVLLMAGLLHDIGKTDVPDEILYKKGKLTDEEFAEIRQHPVYGHRILKAAGADPRICLAALQHHERADGSGYPRGLEGDEIDDFAAIIGIADVYDAMTAARPYRAPLCAFQVIEEFEKDGIQKYKPQYILTFLEHVASIYSNSRVILSDGRAARIVYINKANLSRPIVEEVATGKMLDLSTLPDLHITATV